jgi:hypothetical protein
MSRTVTGGVGPDCGGETTTWLKDTGTTSLPKNTGRRPSSRHPDDLTRVPPSLVRRTAGEMVGDRTPWRHCEKQQRKDRRLRLTVPSERDLRLGCGRRTP